MRYLERDLLPGEEVVHVSMKDYAVWIPFASLLGALVVYSWWVLRSPPGDGSSHLCLPILGGLLLVPYFLVIVRWWRNSGALITNRRILLVELTLRGRVQGAIPLGAIREARVNSIKGREWVGLRLRDREILKLWMISRPRMFVESVNDRVEFGQDGSPDEIDLPQGVYLGIADLAILAHIVYALVLGVLIKVWGPL